MTEICVLLSALSVNAPSATQNYVSYKSMNHFPLQSYSANRLTLKVLVTTIDAQWEGMGDVESARYEPVLLPPCLAIRVLSYSNW